MKGLKILQQHAADVLYRQGVLKLNAGIYTFINSGI